jgi:hypothetical protein
MKPRDYNSLDYQVAFKGTSALTALKDIKMWNENLPKNLYLS